MCHKKRPGHVIGTFFKGSDIDGRGEERKERDGNFVKIWRKTKSKLIREKASFNVHN